MIIGASHWFVAAGIAVAIHLIGALWLSIPEPSPRMQESETVSDELVVTLGHRARATAELIEAAESIVDESVPSAAEAAPETVGEAAPEVEPDGAVDSAVPEAPEPVAPESTPQTLDLESVETAEPVAAETAQARPVDAVSPEPPEAASEQLAEVAALEPSSQAVVEPEVAEAPQTAQSISPDPGESVGVETVESTADTPSSAVEVAPEEIAPARFADEESVPEAAAATATASGVGVVESESVADAGVEAAGVSVEPGLASAPESAAPVRPEEAGSTVEAEAVAPQSVEDVAGVDVATARQPDTEVQRTESPEAVTEAQPETIDLEELQDEGGGSGVVASYAGTLKGWLKENMHYPRAARLDGQEGKVVVRFVIDRDGRVQSIALESESGYPLLDREAQEMIERGDPFPAIPEDMQAENLEIRVPVSFKIRDETLTKEIPPIYLE